MLNDIHRRPASEFEVHSDCYQYLKSKYPLVRGEVNVKFERPKDSNGKTLRNKYGRKEKAIKKGVRFDIVVANAKNKPLFVIEVKKNERIFNTKTEYYEQVSEVKCYTIGSLNQCIDLIEKLEKGLDPGYRHIR